MPNQTKSQRKGEEGRISKDSSFNKGESIEGEVTAFQLMPIVVPGIPKLQTSNAPCSFRGSVSRVDEDGTILEIHMLEIDQPNSPASHVISLDNVESYSILATMSS